ncbi:MAG: DUF4386 family protein [Rhodanobacteraceae bacterium]|nr:DUF4386 family protein [Rhodanobacteraceae bacterium]
MLATFAVGLISNFKLQDGLFADGGLMANAAAHPAKIGLITVLGLATSLLSLGIANLLSYRFRNEFPALLRFYVAILTAGLALTLIEFSTLIAFRELSEANRAGAESGTYAAAGVALGGLRNGVHFLDKLLGGLSVVTLFWFLFSSRLLPRWIASFGMLGAALQMMAVGRAVFGLDVAFSLLAPLSLAFLLTMGWLLAFGFAAASEERTSSTAAALSPDQPHQSKWAR